jgi:hypothetical protein
MAPAASPRPAGTKMMRRNHTMAQVASLQACMEDSNLKHPHPPIIHADNQVDHRQLVVG